MNIMFFIGTLLVLIALSNSGAQAQELPRTNPSATGLRPRRGQIEVVGRPRDPAVNQQMAALLALPTPEPLAISSSSSSSRSSNAFLQGATAAVPAAKANIKRLFFKNNCSCTTQDVFPVIALSYKPVQAADFYTIG